jgi:hypothetical protein
MKKPAGFCLAVIIFTSSFTFADSPKPFKALSRMPIQEITVFKDGHAFVLHSGKMPVGADGNVLMDNLPNPVLGGFWPFSKDKKARLESVTASSQKVLTDRTAINLKELIEANIGAEVAVTEAATPVNLSYRATIHLVIGAPNFEFKDTTDPIGLQKTAAQLSSYFQSDTRNLNQLINSNVVMSQLPAQTNEFRQTTSSESDNRMDWGPNVADANKTEDLFVFTIKHVSLRKGQRMVFCVNEFSVNYKDIFFLEIPFAPPLEVWRQFSSNRQAEIARMLNTPKVMHKIRLINSSAYPMTTAPALLFEREQILSQTLMTYASPGASVDLDVTAAVDIRIKKSEKETGRIPNAVYWQGSQFSRIDLTGKITLTNFLKNPVEVEVVRHVLGNPESADKGGKIEMINVFEDPSFVGRDGSLPYWWNWYSWPYWWSHFNSVGRINWSVTLQPNTPLDLTYTWNYYWN